MLLRYLFFMKRIHSIRFLFLPLFLLLSTGAGAQSSGTESVSGTLITTTADTLTGRILVNNQYDHSWRVQFREEGTSTYRLYRPHEVFSYTKDGGFTYYSVQGDFEEDGLQTVFMREDIKGDVTLYSTMLLRDKPAFFVRGTDGRLIYLQPLFYIDQLRSLFVGCNDFLDGGERINRRYRLNHEGMYSVFERYYECTESVSDWQVEVAESSRKVRFGLIAGFNTSNMRVTGSNIFVRDYRGITFDYVPGYTIGLYLDVPSWSDNVFFKPEIQFTTRGGEASAFYANRPGDDFQSINNTQEVDASFQYFVINLPLRYETSLFGVKPYVSGGGMLGILAGRNTSVSVLGTRISSDDGEVVLLEEEMIQLYNDISLGLNLGLGARMPLGSVDLFAEARYSRIFSNLDDSVDSFRTTALEVLVGFSF